MKQYCHINPETTFNNLRDNHINPETTFNNLRDNHINLKSDITHTNISRYILLFLIITVITLISSGCSYFNKNKDKDSAILPPGISDQPALETKYEPLPPSEGSLWTETSDPFFEDTKARQPGDTLIVDIVENATSSMDAATESKRSSSTDIGIPNLFGYTEPYVALANPIKRGMVAENMVGTKYDNSFKGEAKSNRNGQITASIAARIIDVLPNGNYSVYGKRAIKLNNEVQYIVVSGIVRPEDIGNNNRVQSTYLADSRIEYFGQGVLADKQKQGWGTRLLDNLWPF